MVWLNITQAAVIALGLGATLTLANRYIENGRMTVGTFVMFQQYNLQIYTPLGYLGSVWRWIRQSMIDVEQILNLIELDDTIPESNYPIKANINRGEIEFKNVSFTYDSRLPEDEQRIVLDNVSFKVEAGTSVGIVG